MVSAQRSTATAAQARFAPLAALSTDSLARRESLWGLVFIAPWLVGFVLFFAGPMLVSLGASFTDLVLVRPENTRFVGLDNWTALLADPLVVKSVQVTASF